MENCKTLNTHEATERLRRAGMRITAETLRIGILNHAFPFGTAFETEKSLVAWVYPKKLEAWIKEYLGEDEAE